MTVLALQRRSSILPTADLDFDGDDDDAMMLWTKDAM